MGELKLRRKEKYYCYVAPDHVCSPRWSFASLREQCFYCGLPWGLYHV